MREWGRNYVTDVSLKVLRKYRGAARPFLPQLRQLEADWKKEKRTDWVKRMGSIIAEIEKDRNPPETVSLKKHMNP